MVTICHYPLIELDVGFVMQSILTPLSLSSDPTLIGDALELALDVALALSCDL